MASSSNLDDPRSSVSTMRREGQSISVGDQGQLGVSVGDLKDLARHATAQALLEPVEEDEDDIDDDPRSLLQQRKGLLEVGCNSECCKAADNAADCNKLKSPQCGWDRKQTTTICGAKKHACCRDCQTLDSEDCKNTESANGQCMWYSANKKCGYVKSDSSLSAMTQVYNGAAPKGDDEPHTALEDKDKVKSTAASKAVQDESLPPRSSEAVQEKSLLMDEEEDDEDHDDKNLDARDLLSTRRFQDSMEDCKKEVSTPIGKHSAAECNKATKNQCGWNSKASQCRDCGNLTKDDCETAQSGGSKCAWGSHRRRGLCSAGASSMVETFDGSPASFDAAVKDHGDLENPAN